MGRAYEGLVVIVMELGARPKREPLGGRPRVFIGTMMLDGLI